MDDSTTACASAMLRQTLAHRAPTDGRERYAGPAMPQEVTHP